MRKNKTYEQQKKFYDKNKVGHKTFYQFVRIFNFGKK